MVQVYFEINWNRITTGIDLYGFLVKLELIYYWCMNEWNWIINESKEMNCWMDQIEELLKWILCYYFIYLASTYRIHFTEDTPAQDLLQSRHTYIIHNMQNDTKRTHRVHRTLEEN